MNENSSLITDPAISASRPHKYLGIFGMLWIMFLLLSVFTAPKTFSLGSLVFTVSILTYPFTYIFSDIFTEVYGYRVSRKIVWTGLFCLVLASIIASIYSIIPPSSSFEYNDAFNLIFKLSPILAIATVCSFFSGEFTNSFVLAKLKIYTKGRFQGVRYIGSTLAGQLVDNTIFFTAVGLVAGFFTTTELVPLVLSSVTFCTLWETLALPITYRVIKMIKKKEGLDTYDTGTDFSPFNLRQ